MKGLVSVFTILAGLVIIGFSLNNVSQGPTATDAIVVDYNHGQVALGIVVVLTGLITLRRA